MKYHARPKRHYDWTIVRDALLILLVIFVLVAASSTAY